MKRRSFFKKLGISGLVASVAPQIIQEVKAEPEPKGIQEGGIIDPPTIARLGRKESPEAIIPLSDGLVDEMHLYTPFDGTKIKEYSNSLLKIGRPVEQISVKDAFLK